jgi:hypothetical protein
MNVFELRGALETFEILFDRLEYLQEVNKLAQEQKEKVAALHKKALKMINTSELDSSLFNNIIEFNSINKALIMELNDIH